MAPPQPSPVREGESAANYELLIMHYELSTASNLDLGIFLHDTVITTAIDVTHDGRFIEDVHLSPDRVSELLRIQC